MTDNIFWCSTELYLAYYIAIIILSNPNDNTNYLNFAFASSDVSKYPFSLIINY